MLPEARPAAPPLDPYACPLCNVDAARLVGIEGDHKIARCRRCGLRFLYPRPTDDEVRRFYSEAYYASDQAGQLGYVDYQRHEEGIRLVAREHLVLMQRYLPPRALLDVGCAYGYFLDEAQHAGWRPTGVEISPEAAAAGRAAFGLDVRGGTLRDQAFPAGAFDAVTMWDALEHTLHPLEELSEVTRILRPGGFLFLTVPDASTWIARLLGRHWFGYRKAGEHTYFFTRRTMRMALARAGLVTRSLRAGVWPCDLEFLAEKFAQYSPAISRLSLRALHATGLASRIVRFPLIDMRVVAQRPAA